MKRRHPRNSSTLARTLSLLVLVSLALATTSALQAEEESETKEVKAKALTLKVPRDWKEQEPSSRLRLTQFEIPAAEGDSEAAELSVFSFGGGGDVAANIRRWIGQFEPEGRKVKISKGDLDNGKYVLVELHGTYNKPDGPPVLQKTKPAPGSAMLAVILGIDNEGVYFLKLTGAEKTVLKQAEALRTAFGGDAGEEEEIKDFQ